MDKKYLGILVAALLIASAVPAMGMFVTTRENFSQDENGENAYAMGYTPGTWLLTTNWGQRQLYNTKCPIDPDTDDNYRLGCWSVAIGQIIRYHELQSYGEVVYTWGGLNTLVNDLDAHEYIWGNMPDVLHDGSSLNEKNNVSWLLYDTATVIQKDWGTDYYVLSSTEMVEEIKDHYQYIATQTEVENHPNISEIIDEIDGYRPCMLYLEKTTGGGHAVVIDGYRGGRDFEVHLNMGWYGTSDDWYEYDEPIAGYDNISVRKVIFIRIAPNKPQKPVGPSTGETGINYKYNTTTTSPKGEPIYYKWDWGDGTFTDWLGRYNSGETCEALHTWKEKGNYNVRVKAKFAEGWESPWSDSLPVSMPKNKAFNMSSLIQWLIERCPILSQIFQELLIL